LALMCVMLMGKPPAAPPRAKGCASAVRSMSRSMGGKGGLCGKLPQRQALRSGQQRRQGAVQRGVVAGSLLGRCRQGPRRSPNSSSWPRSVVDGGSDNARFVFVDVVLRKLGKGARAVAGRLVRAPRKGSVVVIEFPDGMHEYVTTPVKRVLRIAGREVFYIETINSRYRLEVRGRETAAAEGTG